MMQNGSHNSLQRYQTPEQDFGGSLRGRTVQESLRERETRKVCDDKRRGNGIQSCLGDQRPWNGVLISVVHQAPAGSTYKIQLKFVDSFGIYEDMTTATCCHWVEIRYEGSINSTGPR